MAHSTRNPETLHWVEDDGRYACNKAVSVTPMKTAFYVKEVTCKNCKKILESRKLDDLLVKFLPNELGRKRSECSMAREMIGKAKELEEIKARVDDTKKLIINRKELAWNKKVSYDLEFLETVLDDINYSLFPKTDQANISFAKSSDFKKKRSTK